MATSAANTVLLCTQITRCPNSLDALPLLDQLHKELYSLSQDSSGHSTALTVLRFYLDHVAAVIAPRLAQKQVHDVLDTVFLSDGVPASLALIATAAMLDEHSIQPQTKRSIRRYTSQWSAKSFHHRLFCEKIEQPTHIAKLLVSFPSRFANAMQGALTPGLKPSAWHASIIQGFLLADQACNLILAAAALDKLLASTPADDVAAQLWSHLSTPTVRNAVAKLPVHSQHKLLQALLELGCRGDCLTLTALAFFVDYAQPCFDILQRRLTNRPVDSPSFCRLVVLLSNKTTDHAPAITMFTTALQLWGKARFVQSGDPSVHACLTEVLTLLSVWLDANSLNGSVTDLMSGVQQHLSCSIAPTRMRGLAAAEVMVRTLLPTVAEGLDLKLPKDDPDVARIRDLAALPLPTLDSLSEATSLADTATPAEPVANTSQARLDEELDSDDDSEDEVEPYTTQAVPTGPRYIRDAVEELKLKDSDFETWKMHLSALPKLIAQRPGELKHLAVELLRRAILLTNEYNFDEFDTLIDDILLETGSAEPLQAARYLTAQFYEEEYSLHHRRLILTALVNIALRVSGRNPKTTQAVSTSPGEHPPQDHDAPVQTADQIIQARLAKKTRRFASKTRPAPEGTINPFASVAGEFFFPLLAQHDVAVRTLKMQGDDQWLFAALIKALGVFIQCAGPCRMLNRMGSAYLEFMLAASPRSSPVLLHALTSSFVMLLQAIGEDLQLDALVMAAPSILSWLQEASDHAQDPRLQQLLLLSKALLSRHAGAVLGLN
eukprot:m.76014 g.76014  ORF g.76014 m.76014 type:complete len:777 (-) comp14418_c0_seq1:86-2416(-)